MLDRCPFDVLVPKVDQDGLFYGGYLMMTYACYVSIPARLKTYEEGFEECFKDLAHDWW